MEQCVELMLLEQRGVYCELSIARHNLKIDFSKPRPRVGSCHEKNKKIKTGSEKRINLY